MKITMIKQDQPDTIHWLVEMTDREMQELLTATVFATHLRKEHKAIEMIASMTVAALCDKATVEKTNMESDPRLIAGADANGVSRFIFHATKAIRETET